MSKLNNELRSFPLSLKNILDLSKVMQLANREMAGKTDGRIIVPIIKEKL